MRNRFQPWFRSDNLSERLAIMAWDPLMGSYAAGSFPLVVYRLMEAEND